MLSDIPVLFVILGVLGVVVGLQIVDTIRRGRARRRNTAAGVATTPKPLMSPIRWAAVGLVVVLLQFFWPRPNAPRGFAPEPDQVGLPRTTPAAPPAGSSPSPDKGKNPLPPDDKASTAPQSGTASVGDAPHLPLDPVEAAREEQRWCNQGDRMMIAGQYAMAAQAYWEALRVQPQSARARAGLIRARRAEALAEQARLRALEAQVTASQGESSYPPEAPRPSPYSSTPPASNELRRPAAGSDVRLHIQRGDLLLEQGMTQAAIAEYQRALEIDPSSVSAREGLDRARRQLATGR